jgi:hypothetical protein
VKKSKSIQKQPKLGGFREGAGAKPMYGEKMLEKKVHLDVTTVERATAIGEGNLSAGLREAVRRVRKI